MMTPETGETRAELALRKVNEFLALLGIVCLVLLTVLIGINVLMRYFLNAPLTWADEYAAYFLVGIIFLGLAYALQDGAHIRIDFLVVMLPPNVQRLLAVAAHLVGLFFAVLLCLGAFSRVRSFWVFNTQSMGEIEIPLYIPALPLLVGTGMFFLVMLARTVRLILDRPARS